MMARNCCVRVDAPRVVLATSCRAWFACWLCDSGFMLIAVVVVGVGSGGCRGPAAPESAAPVTPVSAVSASVGRSGYLVDPRGGQCAGRTQDLPSDVPAPARVGLGWEPLIGSDAEFEGFESLIEPLSAHWLSAHGGGGPHVGQVVTQPAWWRPEPGTVYLVVPRRDAGVMIWRLDAAELLCPVFVTVPRHVDCPQGAVSRILDDASAVVIWELGAGQSEIGSETRISWADDGLWVTQLTF